MTPEQIAQLVTAITSIGALAGAIATYLKAQVNERKIDDNTKITKRAAANAQRDTVDRLRLDELEQWHAVYTASDECEPCRQKMEAFKDRRRRIAPLGTPHDQP